MCCLHTMLVTHLPNAVSNGISQLSGWNPGTRRGKKRAFSTWIQIVYFFFRLQEWKNAKLWFGLVEMRQPLKYENVENSAPS